VDGFVRALVALVAVSNVLPILPVVHEYTAGLPPAQARQYRMIALAQGNLVALGFLLAAPLLMQALDLAISDLRLAGGVVLLTYATHDLLFNRATLNRRFVPDAATPGPPVAPLGVPIFVGPATLSVLLVLSEVHGTVPVAGALAVNVAVNALCLLLGERVLATLGEGAGRAVGKVMTLIVATLGAQMLRKGLQAVIST
jgi:multiple antibiotic resistance protein